MKSNYPLLSGIRRPGFVTTVRRGQESDQHGREQNPWSDGLRAHYEEIVAVSMLLGEERPILCSCCMGAGTNRGVFGGKPVCGQCKNSGYDWIGTKTLHHFTMRRRGHLDEYEKQEPT